MILKNSSFIFIASAFDNYRAFLRCKLKHRCIVLSIKLSPNNPNGITFAIIQEADGSLTVQKIEQSDIALQANQRVAGTFHCGLTYHKNASTAHIHWTATSSQITGVRARVYCKPTYVIGGDYGNYFFYGDIDEYRDLNGRYNTASGATDDFDIDSGLKKVNIGWTSASVSTVRGGTLALPASIDTIELN